MQFISPLLCGEDRIGTLHAVHRPADEEPGRDSGPELVTGELLLHELVVRQVAVECVDHVVAIAPRIGARLVGLEPVTLGEPDGVEPEPSGAFTELRRGEIAVDECLVGQRIDVGLEGGDLFGAGRHAEQIERQPPDQGPAVGGRVRCEVLFGQLGLNKGIDDVGLVVVRSLGRRSDRATGHLGPHQRLKGPVRTLLPDVGCGVRPLGPGIDPLFECLNLLRRKTRPLGRHHQIGVLATHKLKQRAGLARLRHDHRRVGIPASQRRCPLIKPQAALLLLCAVTTEAVLRQDRADSGVEVGGTRRDSPQPQRNSQADSHHR